MFCSLRIAILLPCHICVTFPGRWKNVAILFLGFPEKSLMARFHHLWLHTNISFHTDILQSTDWRLPPNGSNGDLSRKRLIFANNNTTILGFKLWCRVP